MTSIQTVEKKVAKAESHRKIDGQKAPIPRIQSLALRRPVARWPITTACVLLAVGACAVSGWIRWRLVSETKWQADEIPLLVRSTGLCGQVSNEMEAGEFAPTRHSFLFGAVRALKPPKYRSAIHTTTNFWTNLAVHIGGCSPTVGRVPVLIWSGLGLVFSGWAAWLILRDVGAASLAVLFFAISPLAMAYSAQTRGYAEAMALTPLLLIALEWLRRQPTGSARAGLVLLCAIQLALTVYTMWIFWVVPVMLFAVAALPSTSDTTSGLRAMRAVLFVTLLGSMLAVGVYTLDRFDDLAFSGTHMGVLIRDWASAWRFAEKLATSFFVGPWMLVLPLVCGIVAAWRSDLRWWVGAMGLSVLAVAGFTAVNGSPGYERNLAYFVPLGAMLMGVGASQLLRMSARWMGAKLVGVLSLGGGALGLFLGFPLLQEKALAQMPADWGGAVTAIHSLPMKDGIRWIAPCVVNHWQVDWYQNPSLIEDMLSVLPGDPVEFVAFTHIGDNGQPSLYRVAESEDTLVERELPSFVARNPASREFRGVEVRRWSGFKLAELPSECDESDSLSLILVPFDQQTRILDANRRFEVQRQVQTIGAVGFHFTPIHAGEVWPILLPTDRWSDLKSVLESNGVRVDSLRGFSLAAPI